jgi:hypothetical protein
MSDFAAWYRREDYKRIRTIMDDGSRMPATFNEWEQVATGQLAQAAKAGVTIQPVILRPNEFLAYCAANNLHHRGSKERVMFAIARGTAKDLN